MLWHKRQKERVIKMADSNLPIVNAIEDLKADNAKQRKALQDSLGRRFRIIFGKLLGGIGGIVKGLGFGGLLAGAGILMAGGGFLLSELNDLDGAAIRENVKELIGIKDDFGGIGGFFLEGGAFGLTMLGIGAGLAVFGAGSAVAGLGNAIANFTNPRWASSIVDNVATLLSLPDRIDFGSLGMLFKGAAFGLCNARYRNWSCILWCRFGNCRFR
jgi:hypothetical protein